MDGRQVEEPLFFGALEETLEASSVEDYRLVEERAGDRGDRDVVDQGAVGLGERAGTVEANGRSPASRRRSGDVNRNWLGRSEFPEPRC
jgi:hypothetical protein